MLTNDNAGSVNQLKGKGNGFFAIVTKLNNYLGQTSQPIMLIVDVSPYLCYIWTRLLISSWSNLHWSWWSIYIYIIQQKAIPTTDSLPRLVYRGFSLRQCVFTSLFLEYIKLGKNCSSSVSIIIGHNDNLEYLKSPAIFSAITELDTVGFLSKECM